jgi:hypothetical protein
MVLNEESGIYGKHLEVGIKLNAIASANVTLTIQVGNKVVFNPTNCYEGRSVVWYIILSVDWSFEHTAILVNSVVGVGYNAYELTAIQINVVYV